MITHPSSPKQLSFIASTMICAQTANEYAENVEPLDYEVSGDNITLQVEYRAAWSRAEARAAVELMNDLDGQIGLS